MPFGKKGKSPIIQAFQNDMKKRKPTSLTPADQRILAAIRQKTKESNKDNVTRTKAYLDFYLLQPEIHWAFLAHMVSRNGGWNMTDLKGELLARMLSNHDRQTFFAFLERANWLIFQDAFPQLLLYRESIASQKPLFHLLPHLGISVFMETVWNYFWKNPDSSILTVGLIINEQNYIESRLIQNPHYQKEVLNTLEFQLNDILSFNHILFPCMKGKNITLTGHTVHQFESLRNRILIGKKLYTLLFGKKDTLDQSEIWAKRYPHTGSRKDYWPHIFSTVKESRPGIPYAIRLKACQLRPGASRLYSPALHHAWKLVHHPDAEKGDWFKDLSVLSFFEDSGEMNDGDITSDYCQTLEMLELAAFAKKAISIFD